MATASPGYFRFRNSQSAEPLLQQLCNNCAGTFPSPLESSQSKAKAAWNAYNFGS
jgi:hypothetical protein